MRVHNQICRDELSHRGVSLSSVVTMRMADVARRVVRAEGRMAKAVSSLEKTASESTLNTWLQFFPDEDLDLLHKDHQTLESPEELLDYYRSFNEKLVELFDLVGRSTECEATREIFELLSIVEQQNARDLGWAVRGPV